MKNYDIGRVRVPHRHWPKIGPKAAIWVAKKLIWLFKSSGCFGEVYITKSNFMGIILFWLNIVVSSLPSLGEIYILLAKLWKFWSNELFQQSWAEKQELNKLITTITLSYSQNVNHQPFTCQSHKMVKHTQAIRRLLPINWVRILWGWRLCQFGYIKYLSM